MRRVLYVFIFVCMFHRTVYGATDNLIIQGIVNGNNGFIKAGDLKTITCRAIDNSPVEWKDPQGNTVNRTSSGRVYVQEHYAGPSHRGRSPAQVLTFSNIEVEDTGTYTCKGATSLIEVPVCVIDPSEFVNTPTEVSSELGRSITLSCQANGHPEPKLVWYRDDEVISDDDDSSKYRLSTKYYMQGYESQLTVYSLKSEDSGVYVCESIQESTTDEDCHLTESMNITLHVNYAPTFDVTNETHVSVYGRNNEQVFIECVADGYPAPTYRLFKVLDNSLLEFDKKQIEFNEEENTASITIVAGPTTYDHVFKCIATNDYGTSEKNFVVKRTGKPSQPNEVVIPTIAHNSVRLNALWEEMSFPVTEMEVQVLQLDRMPIDMDWQLISPLIKYPFVVDNNAIVSIESLQPNTKYWFRVRARNSVGSSLWSKPVSGTTLSGSEVIEQVITTETAVTETSKDDSTEVTNAPVISTDNSSSTFYGIFFAGGILIVAFIYMFAMRLVR